ncbi:MAG: aconitase family protein, partial [Flavobacteriaceae bacterium]
PEQYFDQVIEIDLDTLSPHLNGPFTPDLATPVAEMSKVAKENEWPLKVEWGLIGSCTNSSYEDLSRAASIAKQAVEKKLVTKAEFGINPGSEQVRYTAERDGLLQIFEELDATIFTNACGPCIGQWAREGADKQEKNSIIHSFNRNFSKRADGNPNTHAFVASPEMVAAVAISGRLDFNPLTDTLINQEGEEVKLDPPTGMELPPKGFDVEDNGYLAPVEDGSQVKVEVKEDSERLQILTPFAPWDGENITGAKLLIKAFGKCTTDHISMAGPWLRFRGHLDNISNNCLIGAVNAFNQKTNFVKNQLTGEYGGVPDVQRQYKAAGIETVVVGDHNYGEGSSREHAAMEPRFLGVKVVLVISFARIHETNLKKQGLLGITFANEADYDLIQEDDTFNFVDLNAFAPGKPLTIIIDHSDGSQDTIQANHSYNAQQIEWFKEGSALNLIKKQNRA